MKYFTSNPHNGGRVWLGGGGGEIFYEHQKIPSQFEGSDLPMNRRREATRRMFKNLHFSKKRKSVPGRNFFN